MPDKPAEKPTIEIDRTEIILQLVQKQGIQADLINAKIDAHRAEGDLRGKEQAAQNKRFELDLGAIAGEVKGLANRVHGIEVRVHGLEDRDADLAVRQSDTDLDTQAAIGGAIAHATSVGEALNKMRDEDIAELRANDVKQNLVDQALCSELGIDYAVVASGGPAATESVDDAAKKKKTTLARIASENKAGIGMTTALVILEIVLEAVRRIH